jgi:hypothetical protein
VPASAQVPARYSFRVVPTLAAGAMTSALAASLQRRATKTTEPTFEDRVTAPVDSLRAASRTVTELENEIESRHQLVQRLRAQNAFFLREGKWSDVPPRLPLAALSGSWSPPCPMGAVRDADAYLPHEQVDATFPSGK